MNDLATGALYGIGMILGLLAACMLLGLLGAAIVGLWTRLRYTRPGWWLHRHWPTPKRR